jgi:tetratricopeptide (TPR) repeat protein
MAEAEGDKMRYFMKVFIFAVLNIFLFAGLSYAEKVTFVKEYTYQASELDSKASCRTISLEMVKRLLLEELGTYLISETEVKDFKLTKDQVKTYSAGIVGAEIIEDKWDGKTYWLKAKVSADPIEVQKSLKKIIDDKYKAKELEESRKKAEELTKEIERLKKEFVKLEGQQQNKTIEEEYQTTMQRLAAMEWFNKGQQYRLNIQYDKAIDAFRRSISLYPNHPAAYNYTGLVYVEKGHYDKAIAKYNKAIALNPRYAKAYNNRGLAYSKKGEYMQAIIDFNKAIDKGLEIINIVILPFNSKEDSKINLSAAIDVTDDYISPNATLTDAYYNRGIVFCKLGNYQQAIKDFNKSIELEPDNAEAYHNRGVAYSMIGNYQQAIADFKIAARLGNKTAQDCLRKVGEQW